MDPMPRLLPAHRSFSPSARRSASARSTRREGRTLRSRALGGGWTDRRTEGCVGQSMNSQSSFGTASDRGGVFVGPIMRALLCLGLCVVGLGAWSEGAQARPEAGVSSGPGATEASSLREVSPLGSDLVGPAGLGGVEAQVAEEALRDSSGAVVAREQSETKYAGLDAAGAARVVGETFPGVVEQVSGGPPSLPTGERITGFVNGRDARVELGSDQSGVIESSEPMALPSAPSEWSPIDLGLSETSEGFEPRHPLVNVSIPERLDDGVVLADAGLSLIPVDGEGSALAGGEGSVDGAGVLYANTQSDTDTFIKPTTYGFDAMGVLRAQDSPQQLQYRVGLPTEAKLAQAHAAAPVEVVEEGSTVATIRAPFARDAAGSVVPVAMSVAGNTITVAVKHEPGEYEYPIIVDPEIAVAVEKQTLPNWHFSEDGGGYVETRSTGFNTVGMSHEGSFPANDVALVAQQTNGVSYIYKAAMEVVLDSFAGGALYEPGPYFAGFAEILKPGKEQHITEFAQTLSAQSAEICVQAGCGAEPAANEGNTAQFVISTRESSTEAQKHAEETKEPGGPLNFAGTLENSKLYIAEPVGTHATVAYNRSATELEYMSEGKKVVTANVLKTGEWLGPNSPGAFEFESHDAGLGVAGTNVEAAYAGVHHEREYLTEGGACEGVQCGATQHEVITYKMLESGLLNGEDKILASAWDAASHTDSDEYGEGEVTLKVDKTPPHNISLTGLATSSGTLELGELAGRVKVEATDGEAPIPSSGVASIALYVDEREIGHAAGSCNPGPCTASAEWALNGANLGAGMHTLTVVATDRAHNVATKEYALYVHPAHPIGLGPGSVNPDSGDFALESQDVKISGGTGSLSVSRHYDSRNTKEGEEGPLGPQWKIGLASLSSLEVLPDKSVMLIGPSGLAHFAISTSGKFEAPPGDNNLELRSEANGQGEPIAYIVEDATDGTSTTFTLPSGAKTWMPTVSKGPAATDTTTDEYRTIEPEAEKKIVQPTLEVAPHPAARCEKGKLEKGCRALEFEYYEETSAHGEDENEWGGFKNRLKAAIFVAYNPNDKAMERKSVAAYLYDQEGRLRAEWNPEVSGSKTLYGYDSEGHVTAITPPGEETFVAHYGEIPRETTGAGRLLSLARPSRPREVGWDGAPPVDTSLPSLSTTSPVEDSTVSVSSNTGWNNTPVSYSYQWESCWGGVCHMIPGATNSSFTPSSSYANRKLAVVVTATNAGGSVTARSAETSGVTGIAPTYESEFGKGTLSTGLTSERALYAGATAVAVDSSGNIWVANSEKTTSKLYVFSPAGALLHSYSVSGLASGLAINQSTGEVYVGNAAANSVEELNAQGERVGTIALDSEWEYHGPLGEENRRNWVSVAVDSAGNVWAADDRTGHVEEFNASGHLVTTIRAGGKVGVEWHGPVAVAATGEHVYVAMGELENERTKGGKEYTYNGALVKELEFANVGPSFAFEPGNGFLYTPLGTSVYEYLPSNMTFTEEGCNCEASAIAKFGSGRLGEALGVAVSPSSHLVYVVDHGKGEVEKWTAPQPTYTAPTPPAAEGNSIWTVEYEVPLQDGSVVPKMGENPETHEPEPAKWGQTDDPVEAVAIFPPDEPMSWPATDYTRATIYYLDSYARTVNVAAPTGGVATTEYNAENQVVRSLSPDNRATALKEECKAPKECASATIADLLSTTSTYNDEGELSETRGPQHMVKVVAGKEGKSEEVLARNHVKDYYDEGAPEDETYDLVTKTVDGAQVANGEEFDQRTATTSYGGQKGLGWKLREPTSETTDPAGLDLTRTTEYNEEGDVVETKTPEGSSVAVSPPMFAASFGSYGAGDGQLSQPWGVAVDATGNAWVADRGNDRVEEFSSTGRYLAAYGSKGSGAAQFISPGGLAVGQSGEVYVADTGNDRIEELSSSGAFVEAIGWGVTNGKLELEVCKAGCKAGLAGSGQGQLDEPQGLTVDAKGDIWVADRENDRVEEFSPTGAFIQEFGSKGSGPGQFLGPESIATVEGDVYVVDDGNDRVQEFSPAGSYVGQFGSDGSGQGQLKEPSGIAVNPSSGDLYVTDSGNDRVQEFSPGGKFLAEFGSYGSGKAELHAPAGIAVNSAGELYVADEDNDRVAQWTPPEAGSAQMTYWTQFGSVGSSSGHFEDPDGVSFDGTGAVWIADSGNGRVDKFTPKGDFALDYGTKGTGEDQFEQPSGLVVNQSSGNIYIADREADRIEELSTTGSYIRAFGTEGSEPGQLRCPGGLQIDSSGDVWVADTCNNRIQEYSSTGTFIATYGTKGSGEGQFDEPTDLAISGTDLYVTDAGNHRIQELTTAGAYVRQFGSEGRGSGEFQRPEAIAINSAGQIFIADAGNERIQELTGTGGFLGSFGSSGSGEGQLNKPQGLAVNPAGDLYVTDTANNRVEVWAPKEQAVHDTKTIYYTAGEEAETGACRKHPEWVGLLCQTRPAAQPETSGLPELPVKTITAYNIWDQAETITEEFKLGTTNTTRTIKTAFDPAGRPLATQETSTNDTPLPEVTDQYNSVNGTLEEQSTKEGSKTETVTAKYNALGQLESYTDADHNTAHYSYDMDGRVTKLTDGSDEGRGEQRYAYSQTTGELTELVDSGAGTFTASYDVQGDMIGESYPNGLTAYYTYNSVGAATGLEYKKLTHCSEHCTWFSDTVVPSIHGEPLKQTSSLSEEPTYTYNAAGQLIETEEVPAGEGCTTRRYAYNEEGQRTKFSTSKPTGEGKCTVEDPTVERHIYDSAGRLDDEGISYETFGNVTHLSAADAGGHAITSEYYVDSQVSKQIQNEETSEYKLDPEDRTLETVSTGKDAATVTEHYDGPGAAVAWTCDQPAGSEKCEGEWTRNIPGIDGSLAAIQTPAGVTLQLRDLQGNIVATTEDKETAAGLLTKYNSTEFGVPSGTGTPPKFSWLGAAGVETEPTGTVVQDGVTYVPQLGRQLQAPENLAPPQPTNAGTPYVEPTYEPTIGSALTTAAKLTSKTQQENRELEEVAEPPGEVPMPGGGGVGGRGAGGGGSGCSGTHACAASHHEGVAEYREEGNSYMECSVWGSWGSGEPLAGEITGWGHWECGESAPGFEEQIEAYGEGAPEFEGYKVRLGDAGDKITHYWQWRTSDNNEFSHPWKCPVTGTWYHLWIWGRQIGIHGKTQWTATGWEREVGSCTHQGPVDFSPAGEGVEES